MSVAHRLDPIFDFKSVAVVGASDSGGTGGRVLAGLQQLGYTGKYFPINARTDRVQGMQAYPSVTALPETPDTVVIAVPAPAVPGVIKECADRGVKAAVILAAGFIERDAQGGALQAQISATARESGLLVAGPNCLGVISVVNQCCGFSGAPPTRPGNVAIVSHSGGLMNELMWSSEARGVGFSHAVSAGNEAGVTSGDYIDYFVSDPATDVILGIVESVRDPAAFVAAVTRAREAGKPVAILKMGLSEKAAHSAATHTGAIAGSAEVHAALFRQKGIIQVGDIDELVDMGALLSRAVGPLRSRRMERAAIIEISGGGKGLLCDTAAAAGVDLPELTQAGEAQLQAALPSGIFATNPIDTGGSWADADKKDVYPACMEVFASEPDVDVVVSRYTVPQTGGLGPLEARLSEFEAARSAHPDRFFVVLSRTSVGYAEAWGQAIKDHQLAFLQGYGRGLRALGRLAEYSRLVHGSAGPTAGRGAATSLPPTTNVPSKAGGSTAPSSSLAPAHGGDGRGEGGPRLLTEVESKAILAAAGIPTVETVLAKTADNAVREAGRLGYSVALKVSAPEIVHKSDQGGVLLGLADAEAVRAGFATLQQRATRARATFQGVSVQPMAAPGLEIILGAHRDPQFGPVIAFGMGGVFVEVLHDVALRVAPLTKADAEQMLGEIRGKAMLQGARGQAAADRTAIVDALCRLSDLMLSRPDIASIDVNPAFAYPKGLVAVDARIELGG